MKYEEMLAFVKELAFDVDFPVCQVNNYEIYLRRPSKLSSHFKNYNVNKNFQIWLRHGNREFRPNHLRIMIDLYLRTRSRPDLKKPILNSFDNIFYSSCPDEEIIIFENERFEHSLNPLRISAYLHQLFLVEQDYCYNKDSNYEPPNLFYQGWIRQCVDSPEEIDNLCMSICRGRPPAVKYTAKENRKHSNYCKVRENLWYLEK
jgi:hypothetical protein